MHDDLHWLSVPQRVQYKLAVTVHRSLWHRAPAYLTDYNVCPVPQFPVATICDLPDVINCLFHVFSTAPSGLGLFPSPVPQFGTHCLMICVIQLWTLYNFGGTWRRTCLPHIRSVSALGVLHNALYKLTFTYLLEWPQKFNTVGRVTGKISGRLIKITATTIYKTICFGTRLTQKNGPTT